MYDHKKHKKFHLPPTLPILLMTLAISSQTAMTTYASSVPYDTYSYDWWGEDVLQPHAYLYEASISSFLRNPQDLFYHEDKLYVADTGNSRIAILGLDGNIESEISTFYANGEEDVLSNPQGVFVTDVGHVYVADSGNGRIIEFLPDGTYIREIGRPVTDLITVGQIYTPTKLVVDKVGRIYAIAYGINLGLVEFDKEGAFQGFLGATMVSVSPFEYIWKNYFATKAQRERMQTIMPTEYSNIFLDSENFMYVTISNLSGSDYVNGADAIRRLNPTGVDILRRLGNYGIIGDLYDSGTDADWSVFADVAATEYGCYFILDSAGGKVHVYDSDGNSLFIFGSKGNREGNLQRPSSIVLNGDASKIYILDPQLNQILVFRVTEYGSGVLGALELNSRGDSAGSYAKWLEVLKMNANSEIAYQGIGKTYLRDGEYKKAMEYFKLSNSRKYYTRAFTLYRKEVMQEQFSRYMGIIIAVLAAFLLYMLARQWMKWVRRVRNMPVRIKDKSRKGISSNTYVGTMKYGFHVIFHPFDGYWDLKRENRGSLAAAFTFIVLTMMTFIIKKQNTAFLFNMNRLEYINALVDIVTVLMLYVLWCVANWCLTSLMDGKGTLRDIAVTTGYSMIPLVIVQLPLVAMSHFITTEEGTFYYVFGTISFIWAGALLFFGTMVTHHYTVKKTILTVLLTILGMIIITFIGLLFFSVIQQIMSFASVFYKEVRYR